MYFVLPQRMLCFLYTDNTSNSSLQYLHLKTFNGSLLRQSSSSETQDEQLDPDDMEVLETGFLKGPD
jgi:hypothetical protein